jgi:hypothetical protein
MSTCQLAKLKHGSHPTANRLTTREYIAWLKARHKVDAGLTYRTYYETVARIRRDQFEASSTWQGILNGLPDLDDRYQSLRATRLLSAERPQLLTKSWDSCDWDATEYDFFQARPESRLQVDARFASSVSMTMTATSSNCDPLRDLVRKYLVPQALETVVPPLAAGVI